ncbi:MAG: endonuclease domain-containing protein [Prevotella sp.]|nr:endonuclease domain-containing protein [Prevotella sp.]
MADNLKCKVSKPSLQGGKGGSPRYKNANPIEYGLLKAYARENRKNMTQSESILWSQIRGKSLGATFLRQYIIGEYITDFTCLDPKLVIEVDGGYHSEPRQVEDDAIRQDWLEKQGFKVIRFTNAEVECDIVNTINKIKDEIHPSHSCKEGEEG